jgi:putative ABC transport system permease protein
LRYDQVKYLPLVWAAIWRKKLRTVLTVLTITVAFLLFGILQGVNAGFAHITELQRLDRLFTASRVGIPLPSSYVAQVAAIPGVTLVTALTQAGAYWRDQKNGLGVVAIYPNFLEAFPEIHLSRAELRAFTATRTGALVSMACAEHYGWKAGDRISLTTTLPQRNGSSILTLDVVGVFPWEAYEADRFIVANYSYVDEARAEGRGTVSAIVERARSAGEAAAISRAIDKHFANSGNQTRTLSERANGQAQQSMTFNTKFFITAVIGASLFTLLFLTGNTMMQSVRERIPELALLKAVGFSGLSVLLLVVIESAVMTLAGAALGTVLASVLMPMAKNVVGIASLTPTVFVDAAIAALMVAFVSAAIPARRAQRLSVADALAAR